MNSSRLQTFIGLGLLVVAILAFLFSVIKSLPTAEEVAQVAKPKPEIPANLFSSDNEVTQKINALNVPSNVPVAVNPGNLGRTNVFENF